MADPTPQDLCRGCGMCCDGTLFAYVPLREDEAEPARRVGLPVVTSKDGPEFAQGCARYGEGGCAIYEARPHACSAFRCLTLQRLEAGEVSFVEAKRRVGRLRALASSLRAALGVVAPTSLRSTVTTRASTLAEAAEDATFRRENAELLLDLGSYHALVERDFQRAASE